MEDVFPKFIIETDDDLGDCLIISKCTYHKDLVIDKTKVKGGGWWRLDYETKTFTLYGESSDFGKSTLEDIKNCIDNGNVYTDYTLSHSIADKYNFDYDTYSEIIKLK